MSFFNKKEDVLHIELTPLGKHYLSLGKLKPYAYKFFDDDILYDTEAAGFSEDQNNTKDRIISETPKLKINGNITGIETNRNLALSDVENPNQPGTQHKPLKKFLKKETNEKFTEEIGTSKNDIDSGPGLKVSLFNGKITKAEKLMKKNDEQLKHIPQIDIEVEFKIDQRDADDTTGIPVLTDFKSPYKNNDTEIKQIVCEPEIPLIRIISEGDFDNKHNFEITCFKVNENSKIYKKLKFKKETKFIENDILLDEPVEDKRDLDELDKSYSDYYFEIIVDKDIPNEDYCKTLGELEVKNIYLDEPIECDEAQIGSSFNVYSTNINPDDLKGC